MGVVAMRPAAPEPGTHTTHGSKAKWAKPMPKTRKNWIPPQSYLAYNWGATDRDPDLDFACFAIEQSGWTLEQIELATERAGRRVSRYCLLGWFYGNVRRPQNATISMVCAVLGWERPWTQT